MKINLTIFWLNIISVFNLGAMEISVLGKSIECSRDFQMVDMGEFAVLSKNKLSIAGFDEVTTKSQDEARPLLGLYTDNLNACFGLIFYGETKNHEPVIALGHWDGLSEIEEELQEIMTLMTTNHQAALDSIEITVLSSAMATKKGYEAVPLSEVCEAINSKKLRFSPKQGVIINNSVIDDNNSSGILVFLNEQKCSVWTNDLH